MAHLSRCCGAPITIAGRHSTHWAVCTCCEQPCDWVTDTSEIVRDTPAHKNKHTGQEDLNDY